MPLTKGNANMQELFLESEGLHKLASLTAFFTRDNFIMLCVTEHYCSWFYDVVFECL